MGDKKNIYFGGWYQRTTLHLTEIFEFLSKGISRLDLSKKELERLHKLLDLKYVTREIGNLEYVKVETKSGIEIRYYEDGLYILEVISDEIESAEQKMKDYFDACFSPAINYIFSLGAPIPKVLSGLQENHQVVIIFYDDSPNTFKIGKKYGELYSETHSKDFSVYKTEDYIFLIAKRGQKSDVKKLVEMQIFFREFKDQLHKYLNIHRKIWEEIAAIKEKKYVDGKEVVDYRNKLEGYKKTIELINNRINQMGAYANTRASLAKELGIESSMIELFRYRFEDLLNTLSYIKEIWKMTMDYVNMSINRMTEIEGKATQSGIRSIQILASIGVVSGIITYLSKDTLPSFSKTGAIYLLMLGVSAFVVDFFMKRRAKNKKYAINFVETTKEI
ncbi:hypothetical protein HY212_07870 [Candidatus Pacearchaeota archaeon]|nr:hypothetical protein [Candidatus Pacearchaeota archaeon]